MQEVTFLNEHLAVGNFGYFFVILSFIGALAALVAYSFETYHQRLGTTDKSWLKIGRIAFATHAVGVLGIVAVLFYIIQNHYYEFYYVWRHSSNALPVRYMISCFWEGQEGSFLLWSFWHVVLSAIFMLKAKNWEAPTMIVIMLAQVMLASMIAGIPITEEFTFGLNPFRLLRSEMTAPIFSTPDYLEHLHDGNGLNALLQNYWMVIHPPTLFLGFAATIFPFALAIAALITGDYKSWVKPALPWTIFTVGILGAGILMGGVWAYEALSFGGFWAWDPVENAVLVPWMIIVGGLHTLVVYKNTGKALATTIIWLSLGFILILYSTYLTRSGVLGDTSVHSFTGDGLMIQLLTFLFSFVALTAIVLVLRWKSLPKSKDKDDYSSRELWMFIASVVLAVAAFQIIFTTSIPVINKLIGLFGGGDGTLAPPDDVIGHYHRFQIPFVIIIVLFTVIAQFSKYRKTNTNKLYKSLLIAFLISAGLTAIGMVGAKVNEAHYIILLWASSYSLAANAMLLWPYLKVNKWKFSGASLAHIGFALLLIGALISTSKQEVISKNNTGIHYGDEYSDEENGNNIYLPLNEPKLMGKYLVTYVGDSIVEPDHYFKVRYDEFNEETGENKYAFTLTPNGQINPQMGGLLANPSTKRYADRDIYTHVTSIDANDGEDKVLRYNQAFKVRKGSTFNYKGFKCEVIGFGPASELPPKQKALKQAGLDISAAELTITLQRGAAEYTAKPVIIAADTMLIRPPFEIPEENLVLFFSFIDTETGDLTVDIGKLLKPTPTFIIMKAIQFPFINILWVGCIIMVIGSFVAVYRRMGDKAIT
ncbi:MAG: cytochrome c biogenesis protein CcsA [Bacteroidetes bacterium]|nr:cytochrome c biogenesis protein CcsA [Bacteroidota bacterium]